MSRSTFRKKAGLIFALAAFVLGVTAATALGWANENNKGKNHGKNEKPPPTATTPAPPPAQQVTPPAAPPAPPAAAPAPAPVVPQGTPAKTPSEQVKAKGSPKQKGAQKQSQTIPAEVTPSTETQLAPVVERKQLARTGLDPVLMALLGAFCLAGGGLLFRRAMAR